MPRFKQLHLKMPGHFDINGTGWIANPTDSKNMRSDLAIKGTAEDLDFVNKILPKSVSRRAHSPWHRVAR